MLWLFPFIVADLVATFEVMVPDKQLKAIHGRPAILGCMFTPDPDTSHLVVTWQRQEDVRVVHSFYYQKDQLDRQSLQYRGRTFLYNSELAQGNASLQITEVNPKDTGRYMCIVTNLQGSSRALVELTYGALYSEPRLSIHINSSAFIVKFETEGFPKPEVNWLSKQGENLTHQLEVIDLTEDGFYFIKSSYVAQRQMVNVTFTLKNHLLNQNLERPVILVCDEVTATNQAPVAVIILAMLCIVLFICIIILTLRRRKMQRSLTATNYGGM
ncbi:butyrophilin subfamily 1 member A1 [Triplophysa dalaica]|uniref:butyrophilin subfamily 1 member A1 n=1 Tax=Triplophysa dalaica TaxID=1582913 RepID=UPI0024DF9968|nr:butyrophilin subfamily 1 member A1 [Triplophysa dalaica]